jgi:hypothetical protein
LIAQYPEPRQIQSLINDLERGSYDELPTALLNADEMVIDETISQIIEQLDQYRDQVTANQRNAPRIEAQLRAEVPQQVTNAQGVTYTPNFEQVRIYETPRNQTVYHASDVNQAIISTREDRLIPNSLSASHRPDDTWGNTLHRIQIPRGTRVGEVDSVFNLLPPDVEDTPRNLGRYLRQYAQAQNLDVLKIRGVHGVGTEYAIINPALLPTPELPEGHKDGGSIQSSKNRLLSPNTDEMRLALLKGK